MRFRVGGTTLGKTTVLFMLFRALADILFIYPMKGNKKDFDEHKDELGFASKLKLVKIRKTEEQFEEERLQALKDEDIKWRCKCA